MALVCMSGFGRFARHLARASGVHERRRRLVGKRPVIPRRPGWLLWGAVAVSCSPVSRGFGGRSQRWRGWGLDASGQGGSASADLMSVLLRGSCVAARGGGHLALVRCKPLRRRGCGRGGASVVVQQSGGVL